MIASLQMYDWPQLLDAYEEYWALIRDTLRSCGIDAPDSLTRYDDESAAWLKADLVLSQTCGMPYRQALHNKVTLVGTANYCVEECPDGYYRSAIVVRADDPRSELLEYQNSVFSFNDECSQSGFFAAYVHAQKSAFWFPKRLRSGGHKQSAELVVSGKADIASLDAVSWRYMREYDAFADQLRVLDWTEPTPGLPYISGPGCDRVLMFDAIARAIENLTVDTKRKLGINSIINFSPGDYLALPGI